MIPVLRPPFGSKHSAYISIVTGRGPGADQSVIDVKAYITWPVVVNARSLRAYLGRERKLCDLLIAWDEVWNHVLHISLCEPHNVSIEAVRMVKVAYVIELTYHE